MHTKQPQEEAIKEAAPFNLDALAEAWPSPIISRSEVSTFSGGLLNPRTLANLNALGQGPAKIIVGKRVCYSTKELVTWMKSRQQ